MVVQIVCQHVTFFNAIVFRFLFQEQIQRIAFLVSCNIVLYRIQACCPSNFLRILKIGKEQAAIFIVTLIITLTNDLITGIFLGIATTFLIHVVLNKIYFSSLEMFLNQMC